MTDNPMHERPKTVWADDVERTAPDEDLNIALVAIRGTTPRDRETGEADENGNYGTVGTTDYRIILRSFGGTNAKGAHMRCGRALRTLEKAGRIVWESSGRIRLRANNDPAVYRPIVEPDESPPAADAGMAVSPPVLDSVPDSIPIPGMPEVHGPFGRDEPKPDTPTGLIVPTVPPQGSLGCRTVSAPVLEADDPPKPAEAPSLADAAQAVLDRMSEEEPI